MKSRFHFALLAAGAVLISGAAQAAEKVSYKYDALGRLIIKANTGTINSSKKITCAMMLLVIAKSTK